MPWQLHAGNDWHFIINISFAGTARSSMNFHEDFSSYTQCLHAITVTCRRWRWNFIINIPLACIARSYMNFHETCFKLHAMFTCHCSYMQNVTLKLIINIPLACTARNCMKIHEDISTYMQRLHVIAVKCKKWQKPYTQSMIFFLFFCEILWNHKNAIFLKLQSFM